MTTDVAHSVRIFVLGKSNSGKANIKPCGIDSFSSVRISRRGIQRLCDGEYIERRSDDRSSGEV